MMILAIDSSAVSCSVALCEDERLIAQSFQNSGLTHSRTLMPMLEDLLKNCGRGRSDIEVVAVAAGPGSFTGLRIGVAAAKGLAWGLDLPCAPCSTLESMAWQVAHMGGEICAVMDARRNQVYNARFMAKGGELIRLSEDRAISIEELAKEVAGPQILVGDGAVLCYNTFEKLGVTAMLPPPHLRYQSAWGVSRAALALCRADKLVPPEALTPTYHRLSQAERERLEKEAR